MRATVSSSSLLSILAALCSTFMMSSSVMAADVTLCAIEPGDSTLIHPVCPGMEISEFCDGEDDCESSFCDCNVGQEYCTNQTYSPWRDTCIDEGILTCQSNIEDVDSDAEDVFFPVCPGLEFEDKSYCDGTTGCGTGACSCDIGKAFCADKKNPCSTTSSAVSFVNGFGSAALFLMGFAATTLL